MNPLLTSSTAPSTSAIPLSIAQTELVAQSPGLPLAQFQLALGQELQIAYLSLHFVGYRTLGFLTKVDTGLPTVYVGLYYSSAPPAEKFGTRPIIHVGLEAPGIKLLDFASPATFNVPGFYQLKLTNNHATSTIAALVTGMANVYNVK